MGATWGPAHVVHFPASPLLPEADLTDRAVQEVGSIVRDFEHCALATDSIDRLRQLHERLFAIAQLIEAVDGTVKRRWDDLLASGKDY